MIPSKFSFLPRTKQEKLAKNILILEEALLLLF
jgi:hypothetical protein